MAKAIVIGTGAGGLTAAIGLAEQGHEVVALEAAKQLGGFLNPFARKHFHFDPGVHYVGQLGPGQTYDLMFERLGLDASALFCPMDPDCFDMVRFPGLELRIPVGLHGHQARLKELFPGDRRAIDRFFRVLRRFSRVVDSIGQAPLRRRRVGDLAALPGLPFAAKWLQRSFADLLAAYFDNPQLRAVIAAQCGDYGLPPSRAPAVLGMGVLLHYAKGAFFPRGGSGALRDALVERGRALGATYRRRSPVTAIHLDGDRVSGVSLASGERLDADLVVSAIDPTLTLGHLLPEGSLSPRLSEKVAQTEPSMGSLCIFLGMRRDLRAHGLGAFNVWDYPDWDMETPYRRVIAGELLDDWFFFLSPNSLKDDSGSMAPAGCSTLEVVTLCPQQPFAAWADQKAFKRGPEYAAVKQRVADSVLASVERRWPGLVGDVVVQDVATPVTNTHYVNAVGGGAYGPAATLAQYGKNAFRTRTPIEGLYLAGSGVFGGGVMPCLASGMAAARAAQRAPLRGRVTVGATPAPA